MAWKTPAGQKTPAPQPTKKNGESSFPGLDLQGRDAPAKATRYEEIQRDEVMAMQAIYGDDFKQHTTPHGAWKKAEPAFDIRVKAPSDEELAATLKFVLVATYPKSPPLVQVSDDDGLRDSTKFKLQKFLETQPKLFAKEEQEMIDRVVEGVRDILEDAAQVKALGLELPSLEEERATHEAEMARLAQEEKEQTERKKLQESMEEERMLDDMLQEELKRQKSKAKEQRKKTRGQQPSPDRSVEESRDVEEIIAFDQPIKFIDSSGRRVHFQKVTGKDLYSTGPITTVYKVTPILSVREAQPTLILKQTDLKSLGKDSAQYKKQLQSLEVQLENLKKLRHSNILEVLDYRFDRSVSETDSASSMIWTVSILTPLADKGSLEELLDLAGHIDGDKARSWTADLLGALAFLHANGIVHQDLHPGNILLCKEVMGNVAPKIADAAYQGELHNICTKVQTLTSTRSAKAAYWFPPEIAGVSKPQYTQKTDVWDFGIVFLQMIFGLDILQKYHSPAALTEALSLSDSLRELVSRFFKSDAKKRPRAFELTSSEFLATNAPILVESESAIDMDSLSSPMPSLAQRLRRDSATNNPVNSRYAHDFIEEALLGKGGFGSVVKARKRLDQHLYAVKKIAQKSRETLSAILGEVSLLSKMNHPAVVRYFNTWTEEINDGEDVEGDTSTEGKTATDDSNGTPSPGLTPNLPPDVDIQFAQSKSRGYDFMSTSGHPLFGSGDDESDSDDEGEDQDDDEQLGSEDESVRSLSLGRGNQLATPARRARRSSSRPFRSILYIVMEYCEKKTLRDLMSRNLCKDTAETWRLFRQILEGLAHIHGLNIIHRDLKPENIFISVGIDGVNNVKIGDFGLATIGQSGSDKTDPSMDSGDMTRSVGTAVYVAPEVRTGRTGSYTSKVDMYSLGVMFFEMCYPPMLGMERAKVLEKLRQSPPSLPPDFKPADANQKDIMLSLLTHNPKERPSSAELLRSGKLPVEMESEAIRRAIAGITDPNSQSYQKVLSGMFERQMEQAKDYAWDMSATSASSTPSQSEFMRQFIARETLISIFRRHGAVETPRTFLYPRSSHYEANVVQVLDQNGTVLQLPYDLMMGHARSLARVSNAPVIQRSYAFGTVFRDRHGGGQPYTIAEVDFDIVTTDVLDLALREAEAIKVLDEIIGAFPTTSSTPMCFHLGHSDLLQLIFEYCEVGVQSRRAAAETLSKLNVRNFTWTKARGELRSESVGISATSVDELQRFDFRDTPSKAFSKLKELFEETDFYQKVSPTLAHLKEVYEYAKRLGVTSKIYLCPLASMNEVFFKGGILFACMYDKKGRDIFAAGGRYDSLIREYRPRIGNRVEERHAVGFSLNWEKHLAQPLPKTGGKAFLKKSAEEEAQGIFSTKRCDVLVASFDASVLRSTGIEILRTLWAHDIGAELARDTRSPEELSSSYRDESYTWMVIIKQDNMLKIKTVGRRDAPDADIPVRELLNWLKSEIRERDSSRSTAVRRNLPLSEPSTAAGIGPDGEPAQQDVRVLVAQTKSKKFNRRAVVEQAQASAARLVNSFLEGHIAAIETSDSVMDMVRATSLSDADSWRRVEHNVGTAEKKYVRDIQDMLQAWRGEWEAGKGPRHAFVYNFRTGNCVYYDLGA